MNRIEPILTELNETMDTEDQMLMIMDALNDTVTPVPEPGTLCTFLYQAKTPRIRYDQHPLVLVTELFQWGFRGFSAHWREPRQYTWNEVGTDVYEIFRSEVNDVLRLSLMNKRLNT